MYFSCSKFVYLTNEVFKLTYPLLTVKSVYVGDKITQSTVTFFNVPTQCITIPDLLGKPFEIDHISSIFLKN